MLTIFGDIIVRDSIINYEDGSILNFGLFDNRHTVDNDGAFFSSGDIINSGQFDNSGILTFDFGDNFINQTSGTFLNFGKISLTDAYFANHGTLSLNGDTLSSTGFIENFGVLNNNSVIENTDCGIMLNRGTINNSFIINNFNIIYNEGLITGNPVSERLSLYNNSTILAADFECTDWEGWTHYGHAQSGKIFLSVFTNGLNIGSLSDQSLTIQIKNDPNLGNGTVNNLRNALYADSDDWYVLNRSWIIKSNVNDSLDMKIRIYFYDDDFLDIQNEFPLTRGIEELFFYEIENSENAFAIDIPEDEMSFYAPEQLINNNSWSKKALSFSSFAEFETRGLNGAFGAGVKSWLEGTIPYQLSFEIVPDVNNQTARISWSTGLEQANDSYTIQRSVDANQFFDIKTIAAQGNTNSISEYTETDETPDLFTENYYRIKLIRSDGSIRYSTTKSFRFENKKIELFPNPATDELYLGLSDFEDGSIPVKIYDMNGKLRLSDQFDIVNGLATENILERTNLEAGIYSLQIGGSDKGNIYRFVKVR